MKSILIAALFLTVLAGVGWYGYQRVDSLESALANSEAKANGLNTQLVEITQHYEQQEIALASLREERDAALKERDHYRRSFRGFNERLLVDPQDSECRINRASAKVSNRIATASGGAEVETPVECE